MAQILFITFDCEPPVQLWLQQGSVDDKWSLQAGWCQRKAAKQEQPVCINQAYETLL